MGIGNSLGCLLGVKSSQALNPRTPLTVLRELSYHSNQQIKENVARTLTRIISSRSRKGERSPGPTENDLNMICGLGMQRGFNREILIGALVKSRGIHDNAFSRIMGRLEPLTDKEAADLAGSNAQNVRVSAAKSSVANPDTVISVIRDLIHDFSAHNLMPSVCQMVFVKEILSGKDASFFDQLTLGHLFCLFADINGAGVVHDEYGVRGPKNRPIAVEVAEMLSQTADKRSAKLGACFRVYFANDARPEDRDGFVAELRRLGMPIIEIDRNMRLLGYQPDPRWAREIIDEEIKQFRLTGKTGLV